MYDLTRQEFTEFKKNYDVYGTHNIIDDYGHESKERDDNVKCVINVMWQPLTSYLEFMEYGGNISQMYFCILYDDTQVVAGDVIVVDDEDYEVVGVKKFNTYHRVDISRMAKNG